MTNDGADYEIFTMASSGLSQRKFLVYVIVVKEEVWFKSKQLSQRLARWRNFYAGRIIESFALA